MSAAQLMADLARLGIRIEAHGDRLRYSPRSAVTPDLARRMNACKGELLAILQRDPKAPDADLEDASQVWQAALDRLEGNPLFPPDVMQGLRAADVWGASDTPEGKAATEFDWVDGWPTDCIPFDKVTPCSTCGRLELWQSLPGDWRCLRCAPPTKAQRWQERTAQLKTRERNPHA